MKFALNPQIIIGYVVSQAMTRMVQIIGKQVDKKTIVNRASPHFSPVAAKIALKIV
jgi:ribosomal protein S17